MNPRAGMVLSSALSLLALCAACGGEDDDFRDDEAVREPDAGAGSPRDGEAREGGTREGGMRPTDAGSDAGGRAEAGARDARAEDASSARRDASPGASGACDVPAIPPELQETIDLTWDEMTGAFEGKTGARPRQASTLTFRNTILDQVMATGGTLNYCVRWDSSATASVELRDKLESTLQRNLDAWFAKLVGYDCFPYEQIAVTVTGWAVRSRDRLQWSDETVPVYVNDIREDAPQCPEACGRFFHQQPGYSYPDCPGGAARHYDMSLWLTDGFRGGVGGDWGQRVATEYVTSNVDDEQLHIVLHEMGHGFGFPDYYNWDVWVPGVAAPNSVMVAGRAAEVTEWDRWMLRHTWSQLKPRWQ